VGAIEKTLAKMRRNQAGWLIEDLQRIAEGNDVEWRRSHVIFAAAGVREIVSVPSKRPIKPVYIKQFLTLIDAAKEVTKNERKGETKS